MPTTDGFRVSPQQRHLWGLGVQADAGAWQIGRAAEIRGALDAARLETVIARLVARHEILRTTFLVLPGTSVPVQIIQSSPEGPVVEQRVWPVAELEGDAVEHGLRRLAAEPLDLERGPAIRFVLFRHSIERHVLAVVASTLCMDLEGLDGTLRAVAEEYGGREGHESDAPMQYADLAEWQHSLFDDEAGAEGIAFWSTLGFLEQSPPSIPFVRTHTDGEPFCPSAVDLPLGSPSLGSARALAQRLDVSVAALALTAWEVVLWRFSAQEAFVIGVACDGRTYDELANALGRFARDLPRTCALDGTATFADHARRCDAALADLAGHQEYFEWDQVTDSAGRWAARHFPVGFRFEDRAWLHEWSGLSFRPTHTAGSGERFAVRADVSVIGDTWQVRLHYDGGRLDRRDAERIGASFRAVLADALAGPDRPLADLDLLDDEGRQRLSADLPFSEAPAPGVARIDRLFERWVAQTPTAPAVIASGIEVGYGELGRRVGHLARRLRAAGVGRDAPVGLLVQRSVDMVVGILGILRAGGAYVPLDPNYPAERLRFMRTDAGAGVVLTTRELAARHDVGDVRVEYLDDAETDEPLSEPAANDEDSLAYIIYTSGSTGTPKGVEVTHANLAHSTIARDVVYGKPPQRFLLLSSFSFDSSVAGIFWTLSGGGALVLPDEGSEADVTALADLIERHQVTHTLGLPSLYQVLLEHGAARLGSLRTVIVAGEACRPELVAAHQAALPRASLYNEYGPTEGTVWSTVFDCGEYVGGPVPIGRPLPNTPAYVLDERRRLLPMGAVGELCIGGPGVARGYRNHPDVTAARFVPDTIGSRPGARLYRTGDRVRYRPDGTLEFLGRVDHQVKVRGHRIELEEIESRLAAAPGVRETAVVAREDTPGDQRLVAYVAPGVDAPAADALIATLRTQLPEHMIPSAIVALDRLPKTATGKVDRAALPPPDQFSVSREAMVEPRTALERVLAGLWADVLGLEVVGVHDDFFKLGGHSLLVTRLVARARELLRLDVPLRAVFEQPTVAGFGEFLRAKSPVADDLERTAEVLLQVAQLSDDGVTAALSEGDAGR